MLTNEMESQFLDQLAAEIHEGCVKAGWWRAYPNKMDRYKTAMILVVSELIEALEGARKNLQDDHLPQYKMFHVELADAAIRLLDSAGAWNISLAGVINRVPHTAEYLSTMSIPDQIYEACERALGGVPDRAVTLTLDAVLAIACIHNVKILEILTEKRAYNDTRPDHKIEVRDNDAHGKKF